MQKHEDDPGRGKRDEERERSRQKLLTARLAGTIVILSVAIGVLLFYRWF